MCSPFSHWSCYKHVKSFGVPIYQNRSDVTPRSKMNAISMNRSVRISFLLRDLSDLCGLRLCRLICGKALPFRSSFLICLRGCASSETQPRFNHECRAGKPQAFRTSDGIAMNHYENSLTFAT